jgi:hypothetical protein
MDYSSSIHDPDHPAGASPWGNSPVPSPQHARTGSYPTSGDVPPSPTPYSTHSSAPSYATEDPMGAGGYNRPESSADTASVTGSDDRRPDTAESVRSQPDQPRVYSGNQQVGTQQQQQRQEPQRYHPSVRQAQAPPAQQYKLQAKITGLERAGRKDPIMRFDVHVRDNISFKIYLLVPAKIYRPTYQSFARPNSAMSDAPIPNL